MGVKVKYVDEVAELSMADRLCRISLYTTCGTETPASANMTSITMSKYLRLNLSSVHHRYGVSIFRLRYSSVTPSSINILKLQMVMAKVSHLAIWNLLLCLVFISLTAN